MFDSLAFSGGVAACVAGLLVALHARLLAPDLQGGALSTLVGLAASGTLVVYGLDRLRDVTTDRAAWPERTAFVERHRPGLWASVVIAGAIAVLCAARQPWSVWVICAGVAALGLWHRRLKSRSAFKIAYLAGAWWSVVVGLPLALAAAWPTAVETVGISLATAGALVANLIGSNPLGDQPRRLLLARVAAAAGVGAALASGRAWPAITAVPLAQLAALWPAESGERARLWWIDGSLAVGAALGLIWHAMA